VPEYFGGVEAGVVEGRSEWFLDGLFRGGVFGRYPQGRAAGLRAGGGLLWSLHLHSLTLTSFSNRGVAPFG
jgi:hypothetical protein